MGCAADRDEGRPERLMATDQLVEAPLECALVERPRDPNGRGDVEGGLPGRELIEEPQGLLGEGERLRADAVARLDRDCVSPGCRPRRAASIRLAIPATVGDSKSARRGISTPNASRRRRDNLGRQERVAAEVEEAVLDADALQSQHRLPDCRHHFLDRPAGSDEEGIPRGRNFLGSRQCFAVDLSIRRQWEGFEHHECRWDHRFGE